MKLIFLVSFILLNSCESKRSHSHTKPTNQTKPTAVESRLNGYAKSVGKNLGAFKPISEYRQKPRCKTISEKECAPLHSCVSIMKGTSGNSFDVTTVQMWISQDSKLAKLSAEKAGQTYTVDDRPNNEDVSRFLEENNDDLLVVTLQHSMTPFKGDSSDDDTSVTESCEIVSMDVCQGRVGYVCQGQDLEREFVVSSDSSTDQFVFETSLKPPFNEYLLKGGAVIQLN